ALKQKGLSAAERHLLRTYLIGWKQTVRISGEDSAEGEVRSGVAQGSLLGPNLFITYISPVLQLQLSFTTRLVAYADDLLVVKPINSLEDSVNLQLDLDRIIAAYDQLKLSINPRKSNFMLCTLAEPHMQQTLPSGLMVDGTAISRVERMRYLGVILDHKLDFSANAMEAAAKAKKAVGALWRTVGCWAGRATFQRIYESKVQPILYHALPMVSPATKRGWNALEKVHRYAARLSLNDFSSSYTDILGTLQWKNMSRLCVERQALTMFKWRNGLRFL
ncbi:MAG: hypothetical protein GY696_02170, partial [Gammaproteobacteria bacterium]|nr:hypothetical protein [Gammaproteobacteria bacterium]